MLTLKIKKQVAAEKKSGLCNTKPAL